MTKEQILREVPIDISGIEHYTTKEVHEAMDIYAKQEVAKVTERAEYAEKVAYETSKKNADLIAELSKEREKAKKLVESAKNVLLCERDGQLVSGILSLHILELKQSLTEYEKS